MARYDDAHKARTRQRILDTAGERLKSDGIAGSGVSALMSDAGLTNGAFYAHFPSKDALVASVIGEQLDAQRARFSRIADRDSLIAFIDEYLSEGHRRHPEIGCPSAALLVEIARSDDAARTVYTTGFESIVGVLADRLGCDDPAEARTSAIGLLSGLVGSIQFARAVDNDDLAREILDAGKMAALRIVDECT